MIVGTVTLSGNARDRRRQMRRLQRANPGVKIKRTGNRVTFSVVVSGKQKKQ